MGRRLATIGLTVTLAASTTAGAVVIAASSSTAAESTAPGTLISSQVVSTPKINGTTYRVQYWSQSVPAFKPVKVSGLIIVPHGPAPEEGWPVLSFGHGTNGVVSQCAPSLNPAVDGALGALGALVNNWLANGWEVVATDYLNENAFAPTSKALMSYLVGADGARNLIDIVRAAQRLPEAQASANYAVWGLSAGAQTALFASNLAARYAPELTLKGSVAMSPPAQMTVTMPYLQKSGKYWPFALMVAAGYNSAYGNTAAPLGQVLTATGIRLINSDIKTRCIKSIFATLPNRYRPAQVFRSGAIPAAWKKLYDANDAARFRPAGPAPVLIVHGNFDPIFPSSTSNYLANRLCALSPPQHLQRWVYSGLSHSYVLGTASEHDIEHWLRDRFDGDVWPDPYTPIADETATVIQNKSC